jgi:hypothetical protein
LPESFTFSGFLPGRENSLFVMKKGGSDKEGGKDNQKVAPCRKSFSENVRKAS